MKEYLKRFQESPFAFDGKNNVLDEKDIGICADIASILTPWRSVFALDCQQGCPYTNTPFTMDVRLLGEKIPCENWLWLPNAIYRYGSKNGIKAETMTVAVPQSRSTVIKVILKNESKDLKMIPFQLSYRGHSRFEENWKFSIPKVRDAVRTAWEAKGNVLCYHGDGADSVITTSLAGMTPFYRAYLWETTFTLQAGEEKTFYISAHIGTPEIWEKEVKEITADYEAAVEKSFSWEKKEEERVFSALPTCHSSDPAWEKMYYRSLVTYILCRWENPALCTSPYISTGSINGSCMCTYLWDYCGGLQLHPIYDPECNKKQLRNYLKNDLTASYAINPVTGGPVGPWYQINQEKIILMVYHHVRATGEVEFLNEIVGDKTVLDWMRYHARVCDFGGEDNPLYDYGIGGNDHLELAPHGNGPYNGVIPDLNARRYLNYMRAYELTVLAGKPDEELPRRAALLKKNLKALWNEKEQWYDFIDADGNRDIRYTVQMFKFLNSPVIDEKEREGLISHLNEREFLSQFGLHSMSKLDPQYDQDDIDNGGGGVCTHFTMQVCAQLYETGHDALATDILKRVLWWGERLPYWGDSCAANMILNRETTPLQGDISSVSCAQMMFYYIFGITPHFDGSITVCPAVCRPEGVMTLQGIKLLGREFDVTLEEGGFSVTTKKQTVKAKNGERITL